MSVYSKVSIPLCAGYFVYRIWSCDDVCLYVGKAGGTKARCP
ncbi:MAG TPA: hypothetical protein VHN16_02255 [Streptosporangiaceae bacterium]|nr:hypothetical protein [Streptosporangiaceae bacterium]